MTGMREADAMTIKEGIEHFAKIIERGIALYRELELPGDPQMPFIIPDLDLKPVVEDDGQLKDMFRALLAHFPDKFGHLEFARVDFLWKEKGGSSGGKDVLGKAKKPSGELRHYSKADIIVVLSVDHCMSRRFQNWQVLALLFHELRHTAVNSNGELALQGHEFEGFLDELEIFGAWNGPNENLIKTVQQMPLFD